MSLLHGNSVPGVVQKAPTFGGVEGVFGTWSLFLCKVST